MLLEATQLPLEEHCLRSCQANQQVHSPLQVLGQLGSLRGLKNEQPRVLRRQQLCKQIHCSSLW